jgi:uncharacterized CHY-type Zn-finger protein
MTTTADERPVVHGAAVDAQTRCVHWNSPLDIVAIQFRCCWQFYPCYQCHAEDAGHPITRWPRNEWDAPGILCGACGTRLTIDRYVATTSCPSCAAPFNPGCSLHDHLYFEVDPPA